MSLYHLRCPGCACMKASDFPFLLMKKDRKLRENQVSVETDENHQEQCFNVLKKSQWASIQHGVLSL